MSFHRRASAGSAFPQAGWRFLPEALLATGAAGFLLLAGPGRWVSPFSDFGDWLSLVQSLLHGARLFQDVHLAYGPLSVFLLLGAVRIFGARIGVIAAFDFVVGFGAAFLTIRFSRFFLRPGERAVAALLMIGLILWMPGSGSVLYPYAPAATIGLCFALAALRAGTEGLISGSALAMVVAGGAAGFAYLIKQETGIAAAAGLVLAAGVLHRRQRAPARLLVGLLAAFLLVVAGGYAWFFRGLPFLALARENHLWPFGTVDRTWVDLYRVMGGYDRPEHSLLGITQAAAYVLTLCAAIYFCWALAHRRHGARRRALFTAVVGCLVFVAVSAFPAAPPVAEVPFLALAPLLVGASLSFGICGFRTLSSRRCSSLVSLSASAALLLARVGLRGWSKGPFAGLGYTLAVPLLVYGTSRTALLPFRASPRQAASMFRWLAAVFVPALLLFCASRAVQLRRSLADCVPLATPRGTVWMPPEWVTAFRRLEAEFAGRLSPGDSVAILPETHGLDFLYDRVSASPAPNLVPGILDERMEARILDAWSRRPPAMIVIFTNPYWVYGSAGFGVDYGLRLRRWISSRYAVSAGAGLHEPPYLVLIRGGGAH